MSLADKYPDSRLAEIIVSFGEASCAAPIKGISHKQAKSLIYVYLNYIKDCMNHEKIESIHTKEWLGVMRNLCRYLEYSVRPQNNATLIKAIIEELRLRNLDNIL